MSEEVANKPEDIGFMITIQKQSAITGEVITVSTNLPKNSLSEDIRKAIDEITKAIDWRLPQADASSTSVNGISSYDN